MTETADMLVIGKSGQVAQALARRAADAGTLRAHCAGRLEADLERPETLAAVIDRVRPKIVVNAAAYTAVDKAESEREAAFRINASGPAALAGLCAARGLPVIHISTDYVFDGSKATPYVETDPTGPLSVYGASKLAGEEAVRAVCPRHMILRTSWVYGREGANFVRTMLRLGAEREEVRVVADQHGAPTFADDIADAILTIVARAMSGRAEADWGTYHFSGGGETTWHGFATEIFRLAGAAGRKVPRLVAIPTSEYPLPARRPANSRLDCRLIATRLGISARPWQEVLAAALREGEW